MTRLILHIPGKQLGDKTELNLEDFLKILKANKSFYSLPVIIFLLLTFFVCFYAVLRLVVSPSGWIYAKVKVNNNTIWQIKSLKKGDKEKDVLGQSFSEILSFRYYPVGQEYNLFLDLKLKAKVSHINSKIYYKRGTIEVGAPLYLEFPSLRMSSTVMAISKTPFTDKLVEKIIHLIAPGGYSEDLPYRYDSIQVGDSYFNGEEVVFKVLEKKIVQSKFLVPNLYGEVFERSNAINQHIVVKAMVKVKEIDGNLVYGEDQVVLNGRYFNPSTNNFDFGGYAVGKIE